MGAFTRMLPSFGFGFLIILLSYRSFIFNICAAATGSLISNLLTNPLFMLLSFKIGELILNSGAPFDRHNWSSNKKETGYSIFIGAIAGRSFFGFATYSIQILL